MTKARSMLSLAEDYLAERRRLGFELTISGAQLKAFARLTRAVTLAHSQPRLFSTGYKGGPDTPRRVLGRFASMCFDRSPNI